MSEGQALIDLIFGLLILIAIMLVSGLGLFFSVLLAHWLFDRYKDADG